MKKIITILCLLVITNISISQIIFTSNFQNWTSSTPITPTDWMGSSTTISTWYQWLTGSTYGTYLCGLQNPSSSNLGLATNAMTVVGGGKYLMEIFVESTQGNMAIGYYDVTNSTYGPVGTYRSVVSPSTGIIVYDSVTLPATCTSAEFIIYATGTPSIGIGNIGVNLDRVLISVLSLPAPPVPSGPTYDTLSIYDIQHTTASSGDSPWEDSLIQTSGVVTAIHGSGYWLQDSASAWNGVYVYDNVNTPALGDDITIRAEVDEFFNLTELKNVDTLITNSTGNALPTPIVLNTTELSSEEKYEGVLCKVSAGHCINPAAGNGEWHIVNTSDTGVVDDMMYAFVPTINFKYDVTGVIQYSFGEYKIEPRDSLDVVEINTNSIEENSLEFSIYPNPVNSIISLSGVNLEKVIIYSINGKLIKSVSLNDINKIDVSELERGSYIMKVTSNNKVGVTRFIKQ
ncbi:T9SS type A sorting domain-containing protein [Flavobacteriales bacterium]|nr:T9SS type A sorting domain-containing protein [Flavobacteriales bacterium]